MQEMGWSKAAAADPVLFLKPSTAYVQEGSPIKIPYGCQELQHEVELGVIIGRKGTDVPVSEAMDYVGGYTVCLDMTARDLQAKAKAEGKPWSVAKGFDTSCPVGSFIPKEQVPDPHSLRLWCQVNGIMRQEGNTRDMIHKIPDLICLITRVFTLEPGDLILTGTPSGVGSLAAGDEIRVGLGDLLSVTFPVTTRD